MNKQTFQIPKGCKAISMEIIDNAIVTTFEPEFKKGDIIFGEQKGTEIILILDSIRTRSYIARYSASFNALNSTPSTFSSLFNLRLATDTEKQLLFDALAKENKAWDAEKMEIVELKYIPKVGDCVRARCFKFEFMGFDNNGYWLTPKNYIDTDNKGKVVNNPNLKTGIKTYDDSEKITPEELQSEFNKLGYEYDFNTHEAKKLRWKPKCGEKYFTLDYKFDVEIDIWEDLEVDSDSYNVGSCFKTEAEAQKFKDYILKYEAQNN